MFFFLFGICRPFLSNSFTNACRNQGGILIGRVCCFMLTFVVGCSFVLTMDPKAVCAIVVRAGVCAAVSLARCPLAPNSLASTHNTPETPAVPLQ